MPGVSRWRPRQFSDWISPSRTFFSRISQVCSRHGRGGGGGSVQEVAGAGTGF